ncbi:hypothetical protein RJ639_028832 [Escallonia herrerae]|uniref:Uncharacterized protein n=1 Tax=Escallonia herrerae TaxID=1293975 RepID=A0AA88X3T3_9ASTE|nr:hypothetical protein RJ639_028832 [Escallonia herrerae]
MNDWAAPLIAAALFAFLTPGLIFQLPGRERPVDFMNMKTSVPSILLASERTSRGAEAKDYG